eukprot:jgi/Phyca11/102261/e_gw1.6.607.1
MAAAPTEAATSSQAPATVPSIDYNEWKADEVRKECTRRKNRLPKGTLKEDRVKALLKKKYGRALPGDSTQLVEHDETRSKHCMFRLLNVLFSDEFAERFSRTGDSATRTELDGKLLNKKSDIWLDVRTAFVYICPEDDERNEMVFNDDSFFNGVNPALAKKVHSAKKLHSMWKEVNGNYFEAQTKFSCSGQNENEFGNFGGGRGDVLYLRRWLMARC